VFYHFIDILSWSWSRPESPIVGSGSCAA